MYIKTTFVSLLILCVLLVCALFPCAAMGEERAVSPAVEKLRSLGFDLTDSVLETIGKELHINANLLPLTDLLLGLGMGDFDDETGEWTPRSGKVYAFDAEVFDIEKMYTLFLQGVQAIVPDLTITDIREDLSGMTDELRDSRDFIHPPTDGVRTVSFVCNGHEYSVTLDSYGDWFNDKMLEFMDEVIEKENCPLKLYEMQARIQYIIVVYGTEDFAMELASLIEPF